MDIKTIEKAYKDREIEINGRVYKISSIPFDTSRKFASYRIELGDDPTNVLQEILKGDGFASYEKLIKNILIFDDGLISKDPGHFERYPEDFLPLMGAMIMVISYPFLSGTSQS